MSRSNVKVCVRAGFILAFAAAALGCGTTHVVLNNDPDAAGGGAASSTGAGGEGGGCSGQCAPLGPGEWLGPLLLWMGNAGEAPDCPASAPVEGSPVFADLYAPTLCGACKCDAPSGACALPTTLTAASAQCIVEIYGPESSGKTTLARHALCEAQRGGGIAAFIDADRAFDVPYAKAMGVVASQLLLFQPDHGEQTLEIVEMLTRSGKVDVIALDSVAALTPRSEIEGEMGDTHTGARARLMSRALRKLTALAHKTETTLIFLNQLRQRTGVLFGNPETTTGGSALAFYASVRRDVRRIAPVLVGDNAVGAKTRVKVVKNKCAVPFKVAEFAIRWGVGIDTAKPCAD
jgi:protein RecA